VSFEKKKEKEIKDRDKEKGKAQLTGQKSSECALIQISNPS
jgi:hypothetical protein